MVQTARGMAGVRVYSTVHVRDAAGDWRSTVVGDFVFVPDFDTAYATAFPRVLTFASPERRLHAAWRALVSGHVGAIAETLAANDGQARSRCPRRRPTWRQGTSARGYRPVAWTG